MESKMIDDPFITISEHEIGTCKITKDLEESFIESCKHNKTTPDDLAYFRSYVWNLIAMLFLKMESIEDITKGTKK